MIRHFAHDNISAQTRPPFPWGRFLIWLSPGETNARQTARQLASLTNEELAWVARSVLAEVRRRKEEGG